MSTLLQEELAGAFVKNKSLPVYKRKNKKELLVSVGYSKTVAAKKPQEILDQKGVKDALAKYGLTEELITTALVEDIQNKPEKRLGELTLGADILGMKGKEENHNTVNILVVSPENQQRYGIKKHDTTRPTESSST